MEFRWNDWNVEHVTQHGVDPEEAEVVIEAASGAYPRRDADGKWLVRGRGSGGRLLQVIYLMDDDGTIYAIHARPLTRKETKRFRRRE